MECARIRRSATFARTRAEREAAADPRPSLQERYGDHAGYVAQFETYTASLVRERLLLEEDAERLIERARSAETAACFDSARLTQTSDPANDGPCADGDALTTY